MYCMTYYGMGISCLQNGCYTAFSSSSGCYLEWGAGPEDVLDVFALIYMCTILFHNSELKLKK